MDLIDILNKRSEILYTRSFLREELLKKQSSPDAVLIGLCGESASGKTTLLNLMKKDIPNMTVVNADNYYRDFSKEMAEYGSFTKLVESGFDTESAQSFQIPLLRNDLMMLKNGYQVKIPSYDMKTGKSTPDAILCQPEKYIVVEGICTLYEDVRDIFDFKIYLTVDKQIQWERYQARGEERSIDKSEIKQQYEIVCRAAERHIQPNKKFADMIIRGRITNER